MTTALFEVTTKRRKEWETDVGDERCKKREAATFFFVGKEVICCVGGQ